MYQRSVDLSNNTFTGSLPNSIADLKELSRLHIEFNQLTGTLPLLMGGLAPHLVDMNLTGNL